MFNFIVCSTHIQGNSKYSYSYMHNLSTIIQGSNLQYKMLLYVLSIGQYFISSKDEITHFFYHLCHHFVVVPNKDFSPNFVWHQIQTELNLQMQREKQSMWIGFKGAICRDVVRSCMFTCDWCYSGSAGRLLRWYCSS